MNRTTKLGIVCGGTLLLVIGGLLLRPKPEADAPDPKGSIYYTGPMKMKGGNSYGTIDGRSTTKDEADQAVAEFQRSLPETPLGMVPTSPQTQDP